MVSLVSEVSVPSPYCKYMFCFNRDQEGLFFFTIKIFLYLFITCAYVNMYKNTYLCTFMYLFLSLVNEEPILNLIRTQDWDCGTLHPCRKIPSLLFGTPKTENTESLQKFQTWNIKTFIFICTCVVKLEIPWNTQLDPRIRYDIDKPGESSLVNWSFYRFLV